jgi:hypothetical protein
MGWLVGKGEKAPEKKRSKRKSSKIKRSRKESLCVGVVAVCPRLLSYLVRWLLPWFRGIDRGWQNMERGQWEMMTIDMMMKIMTFAG